MAARGPALRGKRVDASVMAPQPPKAVGNTYVCGHKPLKLGHRVLHAGVEVPGAAEWTRIDAWVMARSVRVLVPDEEFTSFADFSEAWDIEHPETVPAEAV
jgi:hypothetical protein